VILANHREPWTTFQTFWRLIACPLFMDHWPLVRF